MGAGGILVQLWIDGEIDHHLVLPAHLPERIFPDLRRLFMKNQPPAGLHRQPGFFLKLIRKLPTAPTRITDIEPDLSHIDLAGPDQRDSGLEITTPENAVDDLIPAVDLIRVLMQEM